MNFFEFYHVDYKTGIHWTEIRDEFGRVLDRRVTKFENQPVDDQHKACMLFYGNRWASRGRTSHRTMEAPWLN
jgi:hypothetical protein